METEAQSHKANKCRKFGLIPRLVLLAPSLKVKTIENLNKQVSPGNFVLNIILCSMSSGLIFMSKRHIMF